MGFTSVPDGVPAQAAGYYFVLLLPTVEIFNTNLERISHVHNMPETPM